MKNFIILPLFLVTTWVFGQMEPRNYLDSVQIDFNQSNLIPDSIVQNYDILFVGEIHGFHDNYTIAWKMIREFKQKTNFQYILAEMDWASSQRLNTIINQQDTMALKKYMARSKKSPAWCKERYDMFLKLMVLNQSSDRKIQYIGVDIPSGGIRLALERIQTIRNSNNIPTDTLDAILSNTTLNDSVIHLIQNMHLSTVTKPFISADLFEHNYHINNVLSYWAAANTSSENNWNRIRDSCMYQNYIQLEKHYHLAGEKMIGIWGVTHTYRQESENIKWFASRLNNDAHKKVYSYRIFYFDSKCMLPDSWIPGFLTFYRFPKKAYYMTNLQNDDSWATGKKPGAKDLKKVTSKKSITLFNLNHAHSPFNRLPLLVSHDTEDWYTTQYFQSVILVRNSKATEPFGSNKK